MRVINIYTNNQYQEGKVTIYKSYMPLISYIKGEDISKKGSTMD